MHKQLSSSSFSIRIPTALLFQHLSTQTVLRYQQPRNTQPVLSQTRRTLSRCNRFICLTTLTSTFRVRTSTWFRIWSDTICLSTLKPSREVSVNAISIKSFYSDQQPSAEHDEVKDLSEVSNVRKWELNADRKANSTLESTSVSVTNTGTVDIGLRQISL